MTLKVHIGTGKAGSTFFQRNILEPLSTSQIIHYRKDLNTLVNSFIRYFDLHGTLESQHQIIFNSTSIPSVISVEDIYGWDPDQWLDYANNAQRYLPENSEILLVLRHPHDYLKSLFQEKIHSGESHLDPQSFFLQLDSYQLAKRYLGQLRHERAFDIDNFCYSRLLRIWRSRFKSVTVMSLEYAIKQGFVEFLELPSCLNISSIIKSEKTNVSFSDYAMLLTSQRDLVLDALHLLNSKSPSSDKLIKFSTNISGKPHTNYWGSNFSEVFDHASDFLELLKSESSNPGISQLIAFLESVRDFPSASSITRYWRPFIQSYIDKKYQSKPWNGRIPYYGQHDLRNIQFYERLSSVGVINLHDSSY